MFSAESGQKVKGRLVADWHLLIPGPLEQRTGTYLYDAQIVRELTQTGIKIAVHSLPGRFPLPDAG